MENFTLPWGRLLLGLAFSAAIGGLGYWRRSLAPSGVLGAILIGTLTFGLGGWTWGLLVISFFSSSSLLSHFREGQKASLAEKFSKGSRRDLAQALANGGWGALLAIAYWLWPQPWLLAAFIGSMASVNADTWGTELGVLSRGEPRLITTGRRVPVGTSGAISLRGTLSALAGALFLGLCGWITDWLGLASVGQVFSLPIWLLLAGVGGLAGSLFDSLLGATIQVIYYCDICQKETEQEVHRGQHPTRRLRGWPWLDNDWVNFFSSVLGGLVAAGLALGLRGVL